MAKNKPEGFPRGIRNNNPGNIERKKGTVWQGQAENQLADRRFVVFTGMQWGFRAIARILITYKDKYKANTITKIINRWAPPSENDVDSYINAVAKHVGVDPNEVIDVYKYEIMKPLVEAIALHENGAKYWDNKTLDAGLTLAGVDVGARKSITLTASKVAVGATGVGGAIDAIKDLDIDTAAGTVQTLIPYMDTMKYVFVALCLVSIGVIIYRKVRDKNLGVG